VRRSGIAASFFGGPGFTLYHAYGPHGQVPQSPHFHDEYLICAQIRGHEACRVGGRTLEFFAGDLVLINPEQVHTGNSRGEEVEYVSLYVDRGTVADLARTLGAPTTTPEFTVIRAERRRDLTDALLDLLRLVRSSTAPEGSPDAPPGPGAPVPLDLAVEEALHRVLVGAFEAFSNLRRPRLLSTRRVPHRHIARAVDYIRELAHTDALKTVTLDELAGVAGLSKYHFLREFDRFVGMTPGGYLRTMRLCHAARLLRTTDRPIADVAQAAGFSDHPSFSRAFRRAFGLPPSAYRRLGTR